MSINQPLPSPLLIGIPFRTDTHFFRNTTSMENKRYINHAIFPKWKERRLYVCPYVWLLQNFYARHDKSLRIFNTNVKSVLLYDCDTWKTTNKITRRLQTFINECLRQIMNIKWTNKIPNKELWRITKQKPIEIRFKEENGIGLDTHYVKKHKQWRKLH